MKRRLPALGETLICVLLISLCLLAPLPQNAAAPAGMPSASVPADDREITVALDAGHGGFDGGAVGLDTGVAEAGLNLAVVRLVQAELKELGFRVILTREDENALGGDKNADMAARGKIVSAPEIDLVVSVHMNKFSDRSVSGPMVFYMEGSEAGQKFAEYMINAICDGLNRPRRLANPGDYYMIRRGSAPSVIVECGFLSNAKEELLLQTAEYQQTLASGIASGVLAYAESLSAPVS